MQSEGPRLRVVTGKGGVGKTVVATALALAEAARGSRVLLAEINGRDSVAGLLGAPPVGSDMREVQPLVYVVDVNPADALREYALLTLRFQTVYKAVFENRLVRRFLRLVPSLGELVMLGKIWYHEQQMVGGRPRFDVIIVDLPATGHAVSLLRAARVVQQTMPPGPLRENARLIHELLLDHDRTLLHVVTTPEEMPVNEAIELESLAVDELGMALGATFINQRTTALPEAAWQIVAEASHPPLDRAARALRIREGKRLEGDLHLARLPDAMLADIQNLPRIYGENFGLDAVRLLAERMVSVVGSTRISGGEEQAPLSDGGSA